MKILFVTRFFPPGGAAATARVTSLVLGLKEAGHTVCVVSPFAGEKPYIEVAHPAVAASGSQRERPVLDWLYDLLHVPDPEVGWARTVSDELEGTPFEPDLIVTSSPPESVHLVGYRLSRSLNIPWIADLRDPWFNTRNRVIRRIPIRKALEHRLARHWLSHARAITVVDPVIQEELQGLGIDCSTYVVDEDRLEMNEVADLGPGFHLVYTGRFSLSTPDRDIGGVLQFAEQAISEFSDVVFHIAGALSTRELETLERSGLGTRVVYEGDVPLARARALQKAADALLLVEGRSAVYAGGKSREYARLRKPVLAIGSGRWREAYPEPGLEANEMLRMVKRGEGHRLVLTVDPAVLRYKVEAVVAECMGE